MQRDIKPTQRSQSVRSEPPQASPGWGNLGASVFSSVRQHADGSENDTDIFKHLTDCQTLSIPKQLLKESSSSKVTLRPKRAGGNKGRRCVLAIFPNFSGQRPERQTVWDVEVTSAEPSCSAHMACTGSGDGGPRGKSGEQAPSPVGESPGVNKGGLPVSTAAPPARHAPAHSLPAKSFCTRPR